MDDRHFLRFRALLRSRCGLYFSESNRDDLDRGIQAAMRQVGFSDIDTYYDLLETITNPDEMVWRQLVSLLTIGETYFFRNQWHYKALREHVLPALIEQRRQQKLRILRLWSAGCSTGEEPYSIAILLRELLPDIAQWHISILATDINYDSLSRAMAGVYREWSFRNETPHYVKERYFVPQGETYEIHPDIRQMVRFRYLNLVEDNYPSTASDTTNLDLISCQNVTIYFDRETTQGVVGRFHDALITGGWLIVGHSEPLASLYTGYETHNFTNSVMYRKPQTLKNLTNIPEVLARPAPVLAPLMEPPRADLDTAQQYLKSGNFEAAKDTLHTLLQDNPNHLDGLLLLAKLLIDEGQHSAAHPILDTIEALDSMRPQVHYLRALAYQHMTALVEAKAALRRALYADRGFALAHYYMGEILYHEGQEAQARRSWQNAYDALAGNLPDSAVPHGDGITVGTLRHALEQRLRK